MTPDDVLEGCLQRAHRTADLGAWVALDADGARQALRDLEGDGEEVRRLDGERGALHAIPVAVKDNFDVAGLPTRCGSVTSDPAPAVGDAEVVAHLRAAGAILLGKVATHELTLGVTTRSVSNPWDRARLAGGSSGGSAVAVAVGACLLAVGSDTAGSVRIPAALCGVAGLMGRALPTGGMRHLAPTLDSAGLLAQTAEDLQVAWTALCGALAGRAPDRIGIPERAALGAIQPDVAALVEAAISQLAASGIDTVAVELPGFEDFAHARAVVIGAEALAEQRAAGAWPARAREFGEGVRAELARAESIDPGTLQRARAEQHELASRLTAALDDVDALVWPTTPQVAPPAEEPGSIDRADRRLAAVLTRLCGPVNAAGLAAVSVPCGLAPEGLPVGLQLVARDERGALAAARAYERLGDGLPLRPPATVTRSAA
jgi:aspartyl-tRNA(Asn)/glutamyl-tRNA(Gln) amidotransferase subunit A